MANSGIYLRPGDTEPVTITVDATGLANLAALASATLYMRLVGAATNHVEGAALTIADSATRTLRFDPVGAKAGGGDAFDAPGIYRGYVLLTWTDGDETRHPSHDWLVAVVGDTYE